jgi:hypothetical protein
MPEETHFHAPVAGPLGGAGVERRLSRSRHPDVGSQPAARGGWRIPLCRAG